MVVLFEESRFFLDTALEVLRPAVADITSSFNTHMALLSKLVEAENFASIQEIKDELVDTLSEPPFLVRRARGKTRSY
jgi:hypothetical protein